MAEAGCVDQHSENMSSAGPQILEEESLNIQSNTEKRIESNTERRTQSHTERRTQSHTERRAGNVRSSINAKTWNSLISPRTDKMTVRSSISSRDQHIKDLEVGPFLSVDLLRDARSNYQPMKRDQRFIFQEDKLSVSSPRPASIHSVRRGGKLTSDFCRTFVNITRPANISRQTSDIFLARVTCQPSLRVKMPFKHAINRSIFSTTCVHPGQALIENTTLAVDVMNRIFLEQQPPEMRYRRGRLLKARLKCLEPVTVTEPTIHQCRGIVAETRSYSACSSRTSQRMRDILSAAHTSKDMREFNKGSVYISESIHMTSEASSPDPTVGMVYSPDADLGLKY